MRGFPHKLLSVLAFSASVGLTGTALAAQTVPGGGPPFPPVPPYPSFCYNIDVTNATRRDANDLHFTLTGPDALYSFYTGSHFGAPTSHSHNANGSWTVNYVSSVPVHNGEVVHVGWCADKAIAGMVSGDYNKLPPFNWTWNGAVIGRIPPLSYDWGQVVIADVRHVELALSNGSPTPIRVVQFDWAVVDQPIALNELMWNTLDTTLAWQPLQVEPLVHAATADGPGVLKAVVPLSVGPTEARHMVFRVIATDPAQPENLIRTLGQANIAAAVQPRQGGR